MATDIGKKFFLLIDRHFHKTHKFYNIFNRNNVKTGYSSIPNISSIRKSHNKKIFSNDKSKSLKTSCNCRDKTSCLLHGNYLQQYVIYCSKVIPGNEFTNKNHPHYNELTECSFEGRPYTHKNSFKYGSKWNIMESEEMGS